MLAKVDTKCPPPPPTVALWKEKLLTYRTAPTYKNHSTSLTQVSHFWVGFYCIHPSCFTLWEWQHCIVILSIFQNRVFELLNSNCALQMLGPCSRVSIYKAQALLRPTKIMPVCIGFLLNADWFMKSSSNLRSGKVWIHKLFEMINQEFKVLKTKYQLLPNFGVCCRELVGEAMSFCAFEHSFCSVLWI